MKAAYTIFLVSDGTFEKWLDMAGSMPVFMVESGGPQESEEGRHQVWEVYEGVEKICWLEFLVEKEEERRNLVIFGPLLKDERKEMFGSLLSGFITLGAQVLEGV